MKDLNAEEWLNSIVEEVLKRLQKRMKRATVLFTGGAIGFPKTLQQIKLLQDNGWDLNILLSNSAEYVLTPHLIKEQLGTSRVYVEKEIKELSSFYEGVSAFIVPTLTLNTAVKIALGIADTMTTNLASNIIMQGIPFIAAKDSCDLQNPIRADLGLNKMPKAYLDKMGEHLRTLESYGVKLVDAKDLYQAVQMNVFTFSDQKNQAPELNKRIYEYKKKVLTRNDIVEAKQKAIILKIPSSTILSPLALEAARELRVKIIRE
ncbi:flavoprotein [Schinkia azotoformans]|uniref:flavoprotein n=1 Tax=Schinkia azotoformans TaxID=1454 RepID=UPI001E5AB47D|nr:flavoprotein [Schinkia azotoformans]MEC1695215.1 flavoprotein [Schinkia azotoformans]MEC1714884.1 flavoprotein [Schinkia azotoformans]MEC1723672.1 flavoprotein [Schinkia azotoformans]MEC1743377.1 flavoprotein [Schinkia azotoformans]MEC1746821.1 flavoprotein [Schinkia azotoformans]